MKDEENGSPKVEGTRGCRAWLRAAGGLIFVILFIFIFFPPLLTVEKENE